MKYKFEEINVGDEVYFDSTRSQSNHYLYWKVIHKDEKTKHLIIQLKEMGFTDERWTITIDEVRQHVPINNK